MNDDAAITAIAAAIVGYRGTIQRLLDLSQSTQIWRPISDLAGIRELENVAVVVTDQKGGGVGLNKHFIAALNNVRGDRELGELTQDELFDVARHFRKWHTSGRD